MNRMEGAAGPITVRLARPEDLPALRRLYRTVFDESRAGLDLFFSRAFSPENTVAAQCGGTLCGMFYILPGALCLSGGSELPAAYLYALAVEPAFRGQGAAGKILRFLEELLPARGFAAAILKPAEPSLFGFYARYGYQTAFFSRSADFSFPPSRAAALTRARIRPVRIDALPGGRGRYFSDSAPFFSWSGARLSYAADCLALAGWKTVLCEAASGAGYAVYAPDGDRLRFLEIGGPDRRGVAAAVCASEGFQRARALLPAGGGENPLPQAQILWLGPSDAARFTPPGYFSLGLD